MSDANKPAVQVDFRNTEQEYLAAARLFVWSNKDLLARLIISYLFFAGILFMLPILFDFLIPLWVIIILIALGGVGWFHGYMIDLPRRYFRGNPKYRDEYHLTYSDAGIEFKTQHANGSFDWSFYTGVIENESLYLLVYGNDIYSFSIIPKRAFRDASQEAAFRALLHRHIDHNLKLGAGEREQQEYVPASLEPPDWR